MTLASLENRLRLKHLALLRSLHGEGSLHKASARLHMSQPAASKLLREMEGLFGASLFTRSPSGLAPTPACLMLLEHVQVMLAEMELARSELAAGAAENPIVRIGANPIAVQVQLLPVLSRFRALYPGSQVGIVEDRTAPLLDLLREGRIDLALGLLSAFALRDEALRGMSHRLIGQEDWVVIANRRHDLVRKRSVSMDDLGRCTWVLQPPASLVRTAFEQAFHACGRTPPPPSVEALPFSTVLSIVRSTDSVSIAPRSSLLAPENQGSLTMLKTSLKIEIPPMAVFFKPTVLRRSAVQAMLDLLAEAPASRQKRSAAAS